MIICVSVQPQCGPTSSTYVQLRYGEPLRRTLSFVICSLSAVTIISVQPLYSDEVGPYCSCTVTRWDRTVAVRGHRGTVQQLYEDTDDRRG